MIWVCPLPAHYFLPSVTAHWPHPCSNWLCLLYNCSSNKKSPCLDVCPSVGTGVGRREVIFGNGSISWLYTGRTHWHALCAKLFTSKPYIGWKHALTRDRHRLWQTPQTCNCDKDHTEHNMHATFGEQTSTYKPLHTCTYSAQTCTHLRIQTFTHYKMHNSPYTYILFQVVYTLQSAYAIT